MSNPLNSVSNNIANSLHAQSSRLEGAQSADSIGLPAVTDQQQPKADNRYGEDSAKVSTQALHKFQQEREARIFLQKEAAMLVDTAQSEDPRQARIAELKQLVDSQNLSAYFSQVPSQAIARSILTSPMAGAALLKTIKN